MRGFIAILFILMTFSAHAQKNVAVVKLLRGDVEVLTLGKTTKLKLEDWVVDGSVVKTAEKSFVKIIFIDKSQMNIGPNSEMKIEKFTGKDSGVIDLVKGKIRSQVTKDYLQIQDKDKSKLFIKTQNAVMGVRGTDFMISTNGTNTATVLFEGEIVFNKMDARGETNSSNLEAIVDKGVRMQPGEFSVVEASRPNPTVPSSLNIQQRESLEKNQTFEADRSPGSGAADGAKNSVVPEGLNGTIVSNTSDTLKTEMKDISGPATANLPAAAGNPDGFVNGDTVKPANGSFVHIESGIIIPPEPGSVLDKNTNTYISPAGTGSAGGVSASGNYIPPKNVEITNDGKILVAVKSADGVVKVQEVAPPIPVVSTTNVSIGNMSAVIAANPTMMNSTKPITNDILNKNFVPSGLTDLSNNQRNQTGGISTINDAAQTFQEKSKVNITVDPL